MDEGHCYVYSIKGLTEEITIVNGRLKQLREERKQTEFKLLKWMERRDLETFEGFKKTKLIPKPSKARKKKKDKVKDAINLFREVGIPDPLTFYSEFQKTQCAASASEE